MSVLFAATYPERTGALVLYGGVARTLWAPDYPWGTPEADYLRMLGNARDTVVAARLPRAGGPFRLAERERRRGRRARPVFRYSSTPAADEALVAHEHGDRRPPRAARRARADAGAAQRQRPLVRRRRGALHGRAHSRARSCVELQGIDHIPWGCDSDLIADEVEGVPPATGRRRLGRDDPTGCWPRSCSPTSSGPPSARPELGDAAGTRCSTAPRPGSPRSWRASAAARSTRRRRLPCHLRRTRPRHPLRPGDLAGGARPRTRDPRRPAHRRVRTGGRQARRHRRAHRRTRRGAGAAPARCSCRAPSRTWWPAPASSSGPRRARAQGHSRRMAAVLCRVRLR